MSDPLTCKSCIYLFKDNECRRNPPQVFPFQTQNKITGDISMQGLIIPLVVADDYYCGEYRDGYPTLIT